MNQPDHKTVPPRIYPVPFAREMCDLMYDAQKTCLGQPQLPDSLPAAAETFQLLECADKQLWRHVDLAGTFNYLRRSRRLKIPVEWQGLVPYKLD